MALTQTEAAYCLDSFVAYRGLLAHQIESYNRFLTTKLSEIVLENSDLEHRVERGGQAGYAKCSFRRVWIRSPANRESDGTYRYLSPAECRMRGLSYNLAVYVDLQQEQKLLAGDVKETLYTEALLCRLPCMIGSLACNTQRNPRLLSGHDPSGECALDPRAYFIVNGSEKAVIFQERLQTNRIFVRRTGPTAFTAEVRSLHASKTRSTSTLQVHLTARAGQLGEALTVNLPFIDTPVPATSLLRILGLDDLDGMMSFLAERTPPSPARAQILQILHRALNQPELLLRSHRDLVEEIGRAGTKEATAERRQRYLSHILANEFCPHVGLSAGEDVVLGKCSFFAIILVKLTRVYLGVTPADDRDDFALKRVESTGQLFALLTRQLYRQLLKMMGACIVKAVEANKPMNAVDFLNSKKITAGVKYALSTGVWGVMKQASQSGVAQILGRMNFSAALAHLRRVNTPINREGKLPKPRMLPLSHYQLLCPVESPEGQACGLVENLALMTHVRLGADGEHLAALLLRGGQLCPLASATAESWRLLVNGCIEGHCVDGLALAQELRQWRRSCVLPCDASISTDADLRLVHVDLDAGCLLRPMLRTAALAEFRRVLATTAPSQLWPALLACGAMELIDKNEERHIEPGRSHVDIHDACMLGICAGTIPFLNMNQAPRNIYEAAMTKQSIGSFALNLADRLDTVAHALHYPQVPLVQTMVHPVVSTEDMAGGVNVCVAVLAYTGFNQEDSIIVNAGALQRGLFRSSVFKAYRDEEKGVGADVERFGKIATTVLGARKANYFKVDDDGLPLLGTKVENGDVIIGKRMAASQLGNDRKKKTVQIDHSTILKTTEDMRVRRAYISSNKDGARLARVCLDSVRVPEIGDKLSSHHGQKGVIGIILPEADMPFTVEGLAPDIIVSPHGLPSRMTVGQLLESVLGKLCCMKGRIGEGTPFRDVSVASVGAQLCDYGHHDRGEETLFHGVTGEPLATTVYVGMVHFQRLRHCVGDKVHARNRGPRLLLTRSPVEGRSREGGLRVGEMERDCILAHGATSMLLDRLFLQADAFDFYVCRQCGLVAEAVAPDQPAPVHARLFCRGCRLSGEEHIACVSMPYAMKLLHQELAAMSVAMRFKIQPR